MTRQLLPALRATILLTILTGLIYPGVVTGLCQVLFRDKANGSLLHKDGRIVGSALLGQNFTRPEYFHGRPSAAGANGYHASASGGSNLGPTNAKLSDRVKMAAAQFRKENPSFSGPIPADALTISASGLDPISASPTRRLRSREWQTREEQIRHTPKIWYIPICSIDLYILGEPRITVVALNLELDHQFPKH